MNKVLSKVKTLPNGVLLAALLGVVSLVTAGVGFAVLRKNRAALDAQILEHTKRPEIEKVDPPSLMQKLVTKFGQADPATVAIISVTTTVFVTLIIIFTIQIVRYYF